MNRTLQVFVDVQGSPVRMGTLWSRSSPRVGASFAYEAAWLSRRDAFAVDPELPLGAGQFHTKEVLFRAFTDPAPDRWGQTLLRRAERVRARDSGQTPRTLTAVDFLALVDDETRLGALRFRDGDEGPFLSRGGTRVPPLLELPRLLAATARIVGDKATDEDLALVLAPGTSLGGARPKASVRDRDGALLVAKFPRKDDDWPTTRWEATTLELARRAGLHVASARLSMVAKKPVLLLERFDRAPSPDRPPGGFRVPFASAMTLLSANDGEQRGYLDIAEILRREGASTKDDLRELWCRMVFNILVSNTDDHLRNHGFLRGPGGVRLSPAYDLNPMPTDVRPRVHALFLDEGDATASVETALSVAPRFGLSVPSARAAAKDIALVTAGFARTAADFGLSPREIERMESAFVHDDARVASAGRR